MTRRLIILLVSCSLATGYAFAGRSDVALKSIWRISFQLEPAEYSHSDPEKTLVVLLTNASDHEAWVWESNALNDYDLSLTGSQGKVIPMTPRGVEIRARERSIFFSTGKVQIPPGSSYKNHINLSEFYELPVGRYVVHVRLRARNQENFDWTDKKPIAHQPEQSIPEGATPIEIKP